MFNKLKKLIKWIVLFAWVVAVVLIGVEFAKQNQDLVQLKLVFWQLPEYSSGVIVGFTLLIGVILGLMAFLPGFLLLKWRNASLTKKLKKAQEAPHPATLPKVE